MSESFLIWVEIIFDVAYLIAVWTLVAIMIRKKSVVAEKDQKVAKLVRWMFILLALGDTGHVGFRVIAYATGGLEKNPALVGIGAFATAVTVTFFYMLLVWVWKERFGKKMNLFAWFLLLVGVARLVIMALPGNQWGNTVPPQPMGLIRNIPLMVQGIGIMLMILIDAIRSKDRTFTWIGGMIFLSFLFYTPVILFVQQVPMLGMLMMPKTLAYIAVAAIAYAAFYTGKSRLKQ
jgi:hypothetical protein